jgi:hypothetical protein
MAGPGAGLFIGICRISLARFPALCYFLINDFLTKPNRKHKEDPHDVYD